MNLAREVGGFTFAGEFADQAVVEMQHGKGLSRKRSLFGTSDRHKYHAVPTKKHGVELMFHAVE